MKDAVARYRDAGARGRSCRPASLDSTAPTTAMGDDDQFSLRCSPEVAAERLALVAELGFDDILLEKTDVANPVPGGFQHDFTVDELDEIRSLIPQHATPGRGATSPR